MDDGYDDETALTAGDYDATYSSHENLRLPATPLEEGLSHRERSYSLPDTLDDDYDDYTFGCGESAFGDASRRSLIDSVNFVVKPKRSSLKRSSWRRGAKGSLRRRHPDEAGMIMRRGWFDVRRSIRVKVGELKGSFHSEITTGEERIARG